ncbi:MAG: hypothetical protein AAGF11_13260 [Myxococcota bacterium]
MFPFDGTWPVVRRIEFVTSLARNYGQSGLDPDFLRCIEDKMIAIELIEAGEQRYAAVHLRNRVLAASIRFAVSSTGCRFLNTFTPGPNAIDVSSFNAPVDAILSFLHGAPARTLVQTSASDFLPSRDVSDGSAALPAICCARPPRAVYLSPSARRLVLSHESETFLLDLERQEELLRQRAVVSTSNRVSLLDHNLRLVDDFEVETTRSIAPAFLDTIGSMVVVLGGEGAEVWGDDGFKRAALNYERCTSAAFSTAQDRLYVGLDAGRIESFDPSAPLAIEILKINANESVSLSNNL